MIFNFLSHLKLIFLKLLLAIFPSRRGRGCGAVGRAVDSRSEIRASNPNIGNDKFEFKRNYLSIATKKRRKQRKRGRERPVFLNLY